jgi:hypothetical protein
MAAPVTGSCHRPSLPLLRGVAREGTLPICGEQFRQRRNDQDRHDVDCRRLMPLFLPDIYLGQLRFRPWLVGLCRRTLRCDWLMLALQRLCIVLCLVPSARPDLSFLDKGWRVRQQHIYQPCQRRRNLHQLSSAAASAAVNRNLFNRIPLLHPSFALPSVLAEQSKGDG